MRYLFIDRSLHETLNDGSTKADDAFPSVVRLVPGSALSLPTNQRHPDKKKPTRMCTVVLHTSSATRQPTNHSPSQPNTHMYTVK